MSEFLVMRWLAVCLDTTARTLVLFLAAGIAVLFLRRASAASRHLVWLLALAGLLVLPLLSAALPRWHVAFWPRGLDQGAVGGSQRAVVSGQWAVARGGGRMVHRSLSMGRAAGRAAWEGRKETVSVSTPRAVLLRSGVTHRVAAVGPSRRAAQERSPWTSLAGDRRRATLPPAGIFWLWLGVAAAILARGLAGLAQLWRIGRRCRLVTAAPVMSLASQLAQELGVKRPVLLLHGLLNGPPLMPMTWGFLRPIVLVPTGFAGWPEHRQRAVLLHELAHVKRADWLAQILAQVTCALYWFHPLVWWAARRLRVESERACDDRVLTAGVKASDYATHLLEVVRTMKATRITVRAAVTMARRPLIEERLRAILDARRSRATLPKRACSLALAAAAGLLLPLAAVRGAAKTPPTAGRALPATEPVLSSSVAAVGTLRTAVHVEITPRADRLSAPTPSSASDAASQVSDIQPAAVEPSASDPVPLPQRSDKSLASADAKSSHPGSHLGSPERARSRVTVLTFSEESSPAAVPASVVAAGGDFFAAETADADQSEAKSREPNLADKDLSGADLSGKDLSGKDLSGKDLSGANLSGAKLTRANLSKADLSGANLANADLSRAKVAGADLSGANLAGANLSGVDLSGVDMSGANLAHVNSTDMTLAHADLSGANLNGISLAGRDLSGADLSGADLSGAKLSGANLSKADLSGANLGKADLSHARLKDADLSGANLDGANVDGADLSGADVTGTKLDRSKKE